MTRTVLRAGLLAGATLALRSFVRRRRRIDLSGKIVVVTGGSRGLGLVLCRELLRRGARIALCARDEDELQRARLELAAHGPVYTSLCDLTSRGDVYRFLTEVRDELGPIDVLINNAGVMVVGPAELMTLDDYDEALNTHLWGPLHAMTFVIPQMRQRGGGRIVNIASVGGKIAVPHMAPYSASKFALVGLSAAMRAELAKDSVYVTTACPGLMRTGSPRNAAFRGNHRAEYAWFDIADSLPILSMSAERAARQIIDACEHGDPEIVTTLPARLAVLVSALAPSAVQEIAGVVGRLLPGPRSGSRERRSGAESQSALAPSILTALGDAAAQRNNEIKPTR
ncbi:MAG TPA: SDR family oxidoreductase [Kofleriaceae bacterium]|nr:SDR family oxidoreductase [Kofleriaceae bacterium]